MKLPCVLVIPGLVMIGSVKGSTKNYQQFRHHPNQNNNILKSLLLDKLPDTGEEWTTLTNGVEFQPASNLSPLASYHLRRLTTASSDQNDNDDTFSYYSYIHQDPYEETFVDGGETFYDEYAQAWHALGWYIDCDYETVQQQHKNIYNYTTTTCQRFLLWAAYVDEQYEGNGVHEYMYYDRKRGKWSDKACQISKDRSRDPYDGYNETTSPSYSSRCVKMDCHLPNTHYSLLGFFKEPDYSTWLEQLFQNQGDCLWTDDEYLFMTNNRSTAELPVITGCTKSNYNTTTKDGENTNSPIYYDLKPEMYGKMSIGLYTDDKCITAYTGNKTAEEIIRATVCDEDDYNPICASTTSGNYSQQQSNVWSLENDLSQWNDAFDVFKQCQPCKAYVLSDIVAGIGYQADANYRYNIEYNNDMAANDTDYAVYAVDDNYDAEYNNKNNNNAWDDNVNNDDAAAGDDYVNNNNAGDDYVNNNNAGDDNVNNYAGDDNVNNYAGDDNVNNDVDDNNNNNAGDDNVNYDADDNNNAAADDNDGNAAAASYYDDYTYDDGFRRLGEDGNNAFRCHDGYNYHVNQCMKFASNTKMSLARWSDVELAALQGTITSVTSSSSSSSSTGRGTDDDSSNTQYNIHVITVGHGLQEKGSEKWKMALAWSAFGATCILFVYSLIQCMTWKYECDQLREPLVLSSSNVCGALA